MKLYKLLFLIFFLIGPIKLVSPEQPLHTYTYYLKGADSVNLAQNLASFVFGDPEPLKKEALNALVDFSPEPFKFSTGFIVKADPSINALKVHSTPEEYENLVTHILKSVDSFPVQVYAEIIVVEWEGKNGAHFSSSNSFFSYYINHQDSVKVVSTPSFLVLFNEEAKIFVDDPIEGEDLTLKVTHNILKDHTITFNLSLENSHYVVKNKTIKTRSFVLVDGKTKSGETLVFNQKPLSISEPVTMNSRLDLGKNAAMGSGIIVNNTNFVLFVTPHLIKSKADYLKIMAEKIDERNAYLESLD